MNRLVIRALLAVVAISFALGSYLYYKRNAATGGIEVTDAWVRATPPDAEVAAAYATLRNAGAEPVQVLAIGSDVSSTAEIHEMLMAEGMMKMRQLPDGLTLAAGESATLKPGGIHMMLLGLKRPLKPGESVQMTLQLADGRQFSWSAPVADR